MSEQSDTSRTGPDEFPATGAVAWSAGDAGSVAAHLVATGAGLLEPVFARTPGDPYALGRAAELRAMRERALAAAANVEDDARKALDAAIETLELAVGGLRLVAAGVASFGPPASPWETGACVLWAAAWGAERTARECAAAVDDPEWAARRLAALRVLRRAADECFATVRSRVETDR